MTTLLIATRNTHKVLEIRAVLSGRFNYLTLQDYPESPTVAEDAGSFAGNATKKAVQLANWLVSSRSLNSTSEKHSAFFVLADDSGLEVDALNGAPGVYSARFAAPEIKAAGNSSDAENNSKLLRLLRDVPPLKRTGRFRCVLALTPVLLLFAKSAEPICLADEFELQTELFEGACEGRIGMASIGNGGFGYDSLFIPEGRQESFAELGESIKNQLSHRALALAKLRKRLSRKE